MNTHTTSQGMLAEMRVRRMDRIKGVSAGMAKACLAVASLLAFAMAAYWWITPAEGIFRQVGLPAAELPRPIRFGAFAISMIPLAALIYGLLAARRCFIAFTAGRVFSRDAIRGLKSFALSVAASALLKPPVGAALSLLLNASSPAHTHGLTLSVSSDTLLSVMFAAMFVVIAWILSEATDIADENQQFV